MNTGTVVALSGGIGGAKLALGLYHVLPPGALTVICNPGDDFNHLGLRICPDADTVLYTLAGIVNSETGWGREGETWTFMRTLADLGGETWFQLGDGDLALHVERTHRGRRAVVAHLRRRAPPRGTRPRGAGLGAHGRANAGRPPGVPDFVRDRCEPVVTGFDFEGAGNARPWMPCWKRSPESTVRGVCPSNPFISIDPILACRG